MRSIGYYFYQDNNNGIYKGNRYSNNYPMLINCAGIFVTESPLATRSVGRRDYYFVYIIEGELSIVSENEETVVGAGHFLIVPPDTPYAYNHKLGEKLCYFWIHFTGSDAARLMEYFGFNLYPKTNKCSVDTALMQRIGAFLDASANETRFKDAELATLFERLLLRIAKSSTVESDNPLKKSISFINSSYNTEIRVSDLARIENISISRYNTLFKLHTGMSPIEYIIKTRLSFACELLRTTDLAIKEISMLVGYSDPHFFSRIFRSNIGMSPIQYRNKV